MKNKRERKKVEPRHGGQKDQQPEVVEKVDKKTGDKNT
jgi:hypothetical protein